ncbi:MAG: GntR family transcriptional regulator [Xanthomonadales bacterium]|nr:GntR family transcriptional regulator [Xanthomonadales bacterium]
MNAVSLSASANVSLAEQAYELLEDKLVTLGLTPGTAVSEGRLIEMTGLGRTPVREAIQRLAHQDLFHVMPRKGLLIAPVSHAELLDILEVRKPLERLIAQRAALRARDAQRSELSAIAREFAVSHDRFDDFVRLSRSLDDLLDACSANAYASAAAAPLRSHCRRFWYLHRDRIQLSDLISAHSMIARLVARREHNGAQKASEAVIAVLERLVANADKVG